MNKRYLMKAVACIWLMTMLSITGCGQEAATEGNTETQTQTEAERVDTPRVGAAHREESPSGFAPLGYDAAMTVVYGIQAAEDAGLAAGDDDYKQAVIDAIAGGTINGITGTFTFDEHHNPVKQTAILCFDGATPVLKEMF